MERDKKCFRIKLQKLLYIAILTAEKTFFLIFNGITSKIIQFAKNVLPNQVEITLDQKIHLNLGECIKCIIE